MVDEDDVRLNTANIGPVSCTLVVDKFGISQLPDERGDLRPHTVLRRQRLVREVLQYEAFKERPIKVKSFSFLDRQFVAVDFWTKLPGIGVSKEYDIRCEIDTYLWSPMRIICFVFSLNAVRI